MFEKETTSKRERSRKYTIRYRVYQNGPECVLTIDAVNCPDAYDKAFYEAIPALEGGKIPYSAWVESTTLKNGKTKRFNTFEGKPY